MLPGVGAAQPIMYTCLGTNVAHHQFLVAAKVIGPSVHKEACKAAVAQCARCLLSPEAMAELVLHMHSPKNAFRQVFELMSLPGLHS